MKDYDVVSALMDFESGMMEGMAPNERADHVRQHKMILDALHN